MRIFVFEHFTALGVEQHLCAEGTAMRDALAVDLAALPSVEVSVLKAVSGRASNVREVLSQVEQTSRSVDSVWVIAPETDGLLSHYVELARRNCSLVFNASQNVIAWASHKHETANLLESLGIPHPRRIPHFSTSDVPYIAKPVDGAGGSGVSLVQSAAEGQRVMSDAASPMRLESFHRGTDASVGILCHPTDPGMLPPTRQRFRGSGTFEYAGGELLESADLVHRAHRLVAPLLPQLTGCLGWIGVDLILGSQADGSEDVVVEVNPRLTSSYLVLRQTQGHNLAASMVAAAGDIGSARCRQAE